MEFDRAGLKRSVRRSMKGSGCMMVTLLFGVAVSVGTWFISTILGGVLLRGSTGDITGLVRHFLQMGYEMEEAVEQAVLVFLSQGAGNIFAAVVGGSVLSILAALWQGAMNVGYKGWCLSMVRDENPPVSRIFSALPLIGPVLVTRFLTGLFVLLWSLLVGVGYIAAVFLIAAVAAATGLAALTVVLMLAAFIAFVLGTVWVTMRYALVDYVVLDKGLYGLDAIRESKRLMKDNIGRGWVLQVSFFGWYLLEAAVLLGPFAAAVIYLLSSGPFYNMAQALYSMGAAALVIFGLYAVGAIAIWVLNLWLKPYVTGSIAKFYDWANGTADGFHGGPSFCGGADGGWGGPGDYTWNSGSSGPGAGSGSGSGGGFPPPPPKPPRSPRDDPWN